MANLAQRRGAKAARRREIVRAKRQAERVAEGGAVVLRGGAWASKLPPHKGSAALLDVADFLIDDADDKESLYKKLMMTMLGWNMSLLPLEKREEEMRGFFESVLQGIDKEFINSPTFDRAEYYSSFEEVVTKLINRKTAFYPTDRRWLTGLEILETPEGYRVNVTSEFNPEA